MSNLLYPKLIYVVKDLEPCFLLLRKCKQLLVSINIQLQLYIYIQGVYILAMMLFFLNVCPVICDVTFYLRMLPGQLKCLTGVHSFSLHDILLNGSDIWAHCGDKKVVINFMIM